MMMTQIESIYTRTSKFAEGPHGLMVREYLMENSSMLHPLGKYVILYGPPQYRPPLMLIGNNPSWFGSRETALANLADVAAKIPRVNSYTAHDHEFARHLKSAFQCLNREDLMENCVGLNRFWFQTGPKFSSFVPRKAQHPFLRTAWDKTIAFCEAGTRELIDIISPRSVALVGRHATRAIPKSFRVLRCAVVFKDCRHPAHGGKSQFQHDLADLITQAGI